MSSLIPRHITQQEDIDGGDNIVCSAISEASDKAVDYFFPFVRCMCRDWVEKVFVPSEEAIDYVGVP